jgi:TRAP-type C4-dicarboxylate transport system permease small subunit
MQEQYDRGPASAGPIFEATERLTRLATGAVLIALVTLVCGEAFLRGAFNYSLGFAEELTGYAVVMLTFFGASLALRQGSLFHVHFVFDALSESARIWLTRVFAAFALIICVVLAWKTKDLMLSSLVREKFAPTVLRTPLWIPQMLMPLGFAMIGVFICEKFLLTFDRFKD